jgi:Sulfotransferase family
MKCNSSLPIFILGCQRSGTTLLRRLLDSHSNIACPPESGFIVQLSRVYEIKRALQGLLDMGFSEADVLEQMRLFTAHFFEKYAQSKGKKRWADKTPHYVNHINTIDRMFNGKVLYVGLVRHGLDVACSLCKFDWSILNPYMADGTEKPIAAVRFWKDQTEKLLSFKEQVQNRIFLVRFEELTNRPEYVLPAVFEFLGEKWEEEILKYSEFEHDPGYEDPGVKKFNKIVPNSGNYKKWPLELQRRVYQEAHTLLERLDYVC